VVGAVLRAPALHFAALGAALFAVSTHLGASPAGQLRAPIVISAARVAEIRDDYERTLSVVPTAEELDELIAHEADDEMLYREALILGINRGDRAVMWRVVEKMRFLYGDAAGTTEEAYRRGLALGLDRDDVVVRSALVTKMRLLAKAASRSEEPSGPALERELDAYLHAHPEPYATSERLDVAQIYLSADGRGAGLERDARALQQELATTHAGPEAAGRMGDPFPAGATLRNASRAVVAKAFGEEFAAAVFALPPGRWSAPIPSPYGLHLVWVDARIAGNLPPLADVRSRVLQSYRAERRAQYIRRMMQELRTAYPVQVEHEPVASR